MFLLPLEFAPLNAQLESYSTERKIIQRKEGRYQGVEMIPNDCGKAMVLDY
jgi:hypothetical protein